MGVTLLWCLRLIEFDLLLFVRVTLRLMGCVDCIGQ